MEGEFMQLQNNKVSGRGREAVKNILFAAMFRILVTPPLKMKNNIFFLCAFSLLFRKRLHRPPFSDMFAKLFVSFQLTFRKDKANFVCKCFFILYEPFWYFYFCNELTHFKLFLISRRVIFWTYD